jgi:hypothetical protein
MSPCEDWVRELRECGAAVLPAVVSAADVARLRKALASPAAAHVIEKKDRVYGARNVLAAVRDACGLPESPAIRTIVEAVLGPGAFVVRGLLFDKLPRANWHVGWHQDKAIAVRERIDVPGFGPWSVKAGVPHVQPPPEVLESMLTLRVHLDDCGEDNGPLRVVPGSHTRGSLGVEQEREAIARGPVRTLTVPAGGVVVMRPLTLHASSPAASPSHRRVVHLEYAAEDLPGGLEWHERGAKLRRGMGQVGG